MRHESQQVVHGFGGYLGTSVDPSRVFEETGLKSGDTLLDVGCGGGRFSIPAAEIVGERGMVYAFYVSEERLASLKETIAKRDLAKIEAFVADVTEHISVGDKWIDVCLMANVFHELVENGTFESGLSEIRRVLKPEGILAVVDFKRDVEGPHGPPLSVRLSPEQVEQLVGKYGFKEKCSIDVGAYHYLILFIATDL